MCHIETESENEYVKIKSNRDRSGKYVVADSTGYRVSDEESKRLQLNSAAETVAPLNSPPTATRLLSFFDCRKTLSQIMIYLHFLAYDWNEDVTESRKKRKLFCRRGRSIMEENKLQRTVSKLHLKFYLLLFPFLNWRSAD